MVDLHWQRVEALRGAVGPLDPSGVKALMTQMLSAGDEQFRRYTLARFELFTEGARRPQLQPFLRDLQAAAVKTATLIFEAAGLSPTPERMDELSRLLNGYVFGALTIPGADDPSGLVDRLLDTYVEG